MLAFPSSVSIGILERSHIQCGVIIATRTAMQFKEPAHGADSAFTPDRDRCSHMLNDNGPPARRSPVFAESAALFAFPYAG
jgi:hypothetical protein